MDGMKLTLKQILEAFPSECIEIAPRELKRINKQIRAWRKAIREIKESDYPLYIENFLIALWKDAIPENIIEHKQVLEMLIKIKKNPKMGFNRDKVERAKLIPILNFHNFNKIKKTGRRTMVSCPFHGDKSPSMLIDNKNRFKCFSCGEYGDSISFAMKLHGMEFTDAVNLLLGEYNG